jgi:putative membrane protein
MQKRNMFTCVTIGSSLLLATAAFAKMTSTDVLNDLHKANQKEIHMGQMAESKGASSDMKDYGKMLVNDHKDADQKITDLASKSNITLKADQPGAMDNMKMKSLNSKTGTEFDRQFAKDMVEDHKKDIAKLQKAQSDPGVSQDVKDLVSQVLPKLQKHLETAQKLAGNAQSS